MYLKLGYLCHAEVCRLASGSWNSAEILQDKNLQKNTCEEIFVNSNKVIIGECLFLGRCPAFDSASFCEGRFYAGQIVP